MHRTSAASMTLAIGGVLLALGACQLHAASGAGADSSLVSPQITSSGGYAAMDELPAVGGELRLAVALDLDVDVDVDADGRNALTIVPLPGLELICMLPPWASTR